MTTAVSEDSIGRRSTGLSSRFQRHGDPEVMTTERAMAAATVKAAMPAEQVEAAFGQESFRRRGGATGQPGTATLENALPL
jgi:hypothetical protein